jgi:hypothetical protein
MPGGGQVVFRKVYQKGEMATRALADSSPHNCCGTRSFHQNMAYELVAAEQFFPQALDQYLLYCEKPS